MATERLEMGLGVIEVTKVNNIIYIKALRLIDDDVANGVVNYMSTIIENTPHNIRIYDGSSISPEGFKLTSQCVNRLVDWAIEFKTKTPSCDVYFIAPEALLYGTARMLGMQASYERIHIKVLKSIEELPGEIKEQLQKKSDMTNLSPSQACPSSENA